MDWVKTTARRDEKQVLRFGATYTRGFTVWVTPTNVRLLLLLCIVCPSILLVPLMATGNTWQAALPCLVIAIYPPWLLDLIFNNAIVCIAIMMITYIQIINISMRLHKQVRASNVSSSLLIISFHTKVVPCRCNCISKLYHNFFITIQATIVNKYPCHPMPRR